jgi:mannose-6-phosphate isomerase-like protein (cupin superfamily)
MAKSSQVLHLNVAEALRLGPPPAGNLAVPVHASASVVAEFYAPHGADLQRPHSRDEIYVVARGVATFCDGSSRRPVEPGSFLFVPAHQEHRFEDFSVGFAVWVFFFGEAVDAAPLEEDP